MALSQEVLQNIGFANLMGLDKADRVPVARTREGLRHTLRSPTQHQWVIS
jgi:hypothetical protein